MTDFSNVRIYVFGCLTKQSRRYTTSTKQLHSIQFIIYSIYDIRYHVQSRISSYKQTYQISVATFILLSGNKILTFLGICAIGRNFLVCCCSSCLILRAKILHTNGTSI
jgi:hypothetical protein